MSGLARRCDPLMFRPRSYVVFAITPQSTIADWLATLDANLADSHGFFAGHPVALDLSAVALSAGAIAELVDALNVRHINVLGIEGIGPDQWHTGLPPVLRSGRERHEPEPPRPTRRATPRAIDAREKQPTQPASLMIEDPVRSGQSVVFIEGDVTVLGSVGSGAEVIAGGSIHIYGALRGRALAGATGNTRARIFCHRIEAELLAIDCCYRTADDIDDSLRHRPAQAWLDGAVLKISAMN